MKISKKDYDQYALLWNVFGFLTGSFINISSEIVDEFMNSYGLNSEQARYVAKKENIDLKNYEQD